MATNTSRLGLLKKDTATDGNDTFNIKTMLNDNWDKIDAKVATLGPDGKVPADQLSISVSDASTTQKGVVMLEDSVASTSITKAATPKSVKTVNDALDAHKTDDMLHIDYAVASGTNAYTATIANITSLIEGMSIKVKFTNANTGASTLNINGLGAKTIQKGNGNALSSGNIKAGQICHLVYTGSVFQLLGEGGEYGTAGASQVLSGYTVGQESGLVSGTMPNRGTFNLGFGASVPAGYYSGGTVPDGKKYATGTITSASASKILYGANSNGTNVSSSYLDFDTSILGFVPKTITFKQSDKYTLLTTTWFYDDFYYASVGDHGNVQYGANAYRVPYGSVMSIPINQSSKQYTWEAFG